MYVDLLTAPKDFMTTFNINCERCPRITAHLSKVRQDYPDYHALPVAPFGVVNPRLLIVGLGPGMHGANATGRPFTGDFAGILLYQTLFRYGFSNQPGSFNKNDNLQLIDCRITNAVKCLPPGNKPTGDEIKRCNDYLEAEIAEIEGELIILALGRIAHDAVLRAVGIKLATHPFGHNACHQLNTDRWLLDSYHCSRYNTQTRRLTEDMFLSVFDKIHEILNITN